MKTVHIEKTDILSNRSDDKLLDGLEVARLTITHDNGQVETFDGLSNSIITVFNDWLKYGYTAI